MRTTEYLYNITPESLEYLYYYEALKYKHEHARLLYQDLYYTPKKTWEEHVRMFFVEKAIRHTEELIKEKEERE